MLDFEPESAEETQPGIALAHKLRIEIEEETDGTLDRRDREPSRRHSYGESRAEAIARVEALALRVAADRLESSKEATESVSFAEA